MIKTVATLKNSQGEVLERKVITSIAFNDDLDVMQVSVREEIKAWDGQWRVLGNSSPHGAPNAPQSGFHFNDKNPKLSADFTEVEALEVIALKQQFVNDLVAILERKVVVKDAE